MPQRAEQSVAHHPERSVVAFRQRGNPHLAPQAGGEEFVAVHRTERSTVIEQPKHAVLVRADSQDRPARPHRWQFDVGKSAMVQFGEAAGFVANPERAMGILEQAGDSAVTEFRRVRRVKNREPYAVKPRQAIVGGHPQITVTVLHDGIHRVLRKTLLDLQPTRRIIAQR